MEMRARILLVLAFPAILISCSHGVHLNSNGGYEDIVVSIGKEVPPIACQQIIQNIQAIFTSASEYLREATDGRVYFHRITIVVPPMWDTRACGRSLPANSFTSRSSINDATFRIGTEHPIFGHLPWTQQSRSCGLPGDFISMGYHYILQYNETENVANNGQPVNNNHVSQSSIRDDWSTGNFNGGSGDSKPAGFDFRSVPTERAFVHEWAKYRYGVFEEIGFPNDPIYPPFYTDSRSGEKKPTACTNHQIHGNWSSGCDSSNNYGYLFNNRRNGSSSSSSAAAGSSPTSPSCVFTPDSSSGYENDRISSSIMSFPQGRNVRAFCDSTTHNTRAPTKQNFLCDRKSTSEVIFEHPDFQSLPTREPNVPVPAPEFIVRQITQPRFVLLVEETGNMNLRDVWKFLKLAVRKFIKYDLATGTQIGLITVSSNDVRVLANMTSLKSLTIRRALADKLANYPNVDGGGNIALRRGVFQAVDLLKRNQQKAAGSVIILISQGTVSSMDLETSLELLREEEVALASIEYPSLSDGKIAQLAEGTNGPHFTIRETGVGPMTHLSTYIHLINALMSIQKFYTEDVASSWPIMIHQTEYRGDLRSYIESNFSFESNAIQTQGEFFIYTSNPNDPKINSVELTSPNGVKYTTQLSDLHDINVIKIDAVINEPGVWRYRIERLADSHQSHFVQVVTKTTSEDLYVRLYTNIPVNRVANLTSTPLILYTEVKRKNSPVIDADVEALIVAGNKKWTVKLLDNGNGDPDVTRNDGVYSRYFIVPQGVTTSQLEISSKVIVNPYRARFVVVSQDPLYQTGTSSATNSNNNSLLPCCGSFMAPADPRQQYKIVPFGERSSNSLVVRISDVPSLGSYPPGRIGDLQVDSIDGLDRTASLRWTAPGEDYDQGIVASYQIFYSLDSFNEDWKLLTEFTADIEAGVEDNSTITLPYYGSFLITMSAIDFYGRAGKASNIVPLSVFQPPREPDPTQSPSHANTLGITNTTPPSTEELTKLDLILIIICAVVFILLLSGLIVLLLYCRKLGTSNRKSAKTANEAKIAAIADPKSPIHWSASELLGEHEKRHSMYDGSVIPENGSANSDSSKQRQAHYHVNHGLQNGSGPPQHSMHLNIVSPSQEYNGMMVGGSSPSHRASSPDDSYDDPECPTPIPVSVRNRHPPLEYGVCNEQSTSTQTSCSNNSAIMSNNAGMMNRSMNYPQEPPPQYHHYQMPQNNSVYQPQQHQQYPHYQHQQHILENNHRFSINSELSNNSSRVSQTFKNIKVPPPPLPPSQQQTLLLPLSHSHNPHHLNQGLISRSTSTTSSGGGQPHPQQHLMHYDPDLQGSMTSVNSKKKNITMV